MRKLWQKIPAVAVLIAPLSVGAEVLQVPSGQPVEFFEVIWEAEADVNTYRFRYIAPEIARDSGKISFEQAEADIKHLCESSALPALIAQGRSVDKIVISISDQAVEFGKSAPEVTQFFEVYSPEGTTCRWEGF